MSFDFSPPVPLTRQTHIEIQDPDEHLHRRRRPSQAARLRVPGLNRDEFFRRRENEDRHEIQTMLPNYLYMHEQEEKIANQEEEENARRVLNFDNIDVNEPREFQELPTGQVAQQAGEPDLEYFTRLQNVDEREFRENQLGMPRANLPYIMRPRGPMTREQQEREGRRIIRLREREREDEEKERQIQRRRQLFRERMEDLRQQYPPYPGESDENYDERIETTYHTRYNRSDLPNPPRGQNRQRRRRSRRSSSIEQRIKKRVSRRRSTKRVSRRRSTKRVSRRRSTKRVSRRRSTKRVSRARKGSRRRY
jgi:hypothetical protein